MTSGIHQGAAMRHPKFRLIVSALIFGSILLPMTSQATISFPFSLTFNCPAEDERSAGWPNSGGQCVGLNLSSTGGDGKGNYESVTDLANYPGGGGSRGERHWIGPGKNNHTSPIDLYFSPQKEMWVRWYLRYEAGTLVNPAYGVNPAIGDDVPLNQKMLYFFDNSSPQRIDHILYLQPNGWGVVNNGQYIARASHGWNSLSSNTPTFPAQVTNLLNKEAIAAADGSWHCIEYHFKMQNPQSSANGVAELWIDNIQYMNATNLTWTYDGVGWNRVGTTGNTEGMVGILCPSPCSNGNVVNGYRAIAEDLDDFAMSTTGRIGCLSGASAPPSPPTNLKVN